MNADPVDGDTVTCPTCGWTGDRLQYAQCPESGDDLWDIDDDPGTSTGSGAPVQPRVVLRIGAGSWTLSPGDRLGLGRDESFPTAAALAAHDNVSRYHAYVRYDGGQLRVVDTESSNHTFVNGAEIPANKEYEIGRGQTLRLAADVPIEIEWDA